MHKRPFIKDVRSQGGGVVQCGHFTDKGSFICGRPHFLAKKNFGFFEIYGVSVRTRGEGGLSQCGHFSNKGGGEVNFSRFCADVFYGRPLMNKQSWL